MSVVELNVVSARVKTEWHGIYVEVLEMEMADIYICFRPGRNEIVTI